MYTVTYMNERGSVMVRSWGSLLEAYTDARILLRRGWAMVGDVAGPPVDTVSLGWGG